MKDPKEREVFLSLVLPDKTPRLDKATIDSLKLAFERDDMRERLENVWNDVVDVWGETDNAMDFLFHSHPMLGDNRPIDTVLASEQGAEAVHNILGRLRYGSAA